jgi:hypothetical protein
MKSFHISMRLLIKIKHTFYRVLFRNNLYFYRKFTNMKTERNPLSEFERRKIGVSGVSEKQMYNLSPQKRPETCKPF